MILAIGLLLFEQIESTSLMCPSRSKPLIRLKKSLGITLSSRKLIKRSIIIARESGIKGFYGTIHIQNKGAMHLIQRAGRTIVTPPEAGEKELFWELFFDEE